MMMMMSHYRARQYLRSSYFEQAEVLILILGQGVSYTNLSIHDFFLMFSFRIQAEYSAVLIVYFVAYSRLQGNTRSCRSGGSSGSNGNSSRRSGIHSI